MIFLVPVTLAMALIGIVFYFRQNRGQKLGGDISAAKAFWLFYCIYTWLFLIPYTVFHNGVEDPFRATWLVFAVWFWLRALVEGHMLFISKNWTPPIGIAHDLSCLIILLAGPLYSGIKWSDWSTHTGIFHVSLVLSLAMETYYAYAFHKIVGAGTKGEKGVWYANKEDPVFKRIVRVTTIANVPLYAALVFFLGRLASI